MAFYISGDCQISALLCPGLNLGHQFLLAPCGWLNYHLGAHSFSTLMARPAQLFDILKKDKALALLLAGFNFFSR
jgi:hypothetical protein